MKVCIVSLNIVPYFLDAPFGGAETQAAFLAKALTAAGTEVVLVVADKTEELPYPAENAYFKRDGIPGLRFFRPRLSGILDSLARADADVYYQRNAGMVTGVTAWFCRRAGRVFVYGAGSDADFSRRDVIIDGARDKLLYFYGLKRADGVVVQNEAQAATYRARFRRDPRIIPNGVVLEDGNGARAPQKHRVVAWVGALRAVKRPEMFLDLARRIPDAEFVMVGGAVGSEPKYAEAMLRQAEAFPNVIAPGRISPVAVSELLARASLLVNTSSVEGFPNVFLEAWRAYTPVLSFVDVGGLVAREQVGVVCTDFEDLAAHTRRLLDDAAARGDMGSRARRLVEKRFSSTVLGGEYLHWFEDLVKAKRA